VTQVRIHGSRCLITGGAGTIGSTIADQLVAAGAGEVVVLDNFVRGRRANLEQAAASGLVTVVEGDIRDRELLARIMPGVDLLFHQAAIRITQCAEEPRLARAGLLDRHRVRRSVFYGLNATGASLVTLLADVPEALSA